MSETAVATPTDADFGPASNGKLGMWVFLVTDAMGFAGFLLAYAILRASAGAWPSPGERLDVRLAAGMTAVLVTSSLLVLRALAAARRGAPRAAAGWLAAAAGGGLVFLAAQGFEWAQLIGPHGMSPDRDRLAATFFAITGFHGAHVLVGVACLGVLAASGLRRPLAANLVEVVGLYWHFVDVVWVLIFAFVYLLPPPGAAAAAGRAGVVALAAAYAVAAGVFVMNLRRERWALRLTVGLPLLVPCLYALALTLDAGARFGVGR